jgi:hypothetical protein
MAGTNSDRVMLIGFTWLRCTPAGSRHACSSVMENPSVPVEPTGLPTKPLADEMCGAPMHWVSSLVPYDQIA